MKILTEKDTKEGIMTALVDNDKNLLKITKEISKEYDIQFGREELLIDFLHSKTYTILFIKMK